MDRTTSPFRCPCTYTRHYRPPSRGMELQGISWRWFISWFSESFYLGINNAIESERWVNRFVAVFLQITQCTLNWVIGLNDNDLQRNHKKFGHCALLYSQLKARHSDRGGTNDLCCGFVWKSNQEGWNYENCSKSRQGIDDHEMFANAQWVLNRKPEKIMVGHIDDNEGGASHVIELTSALCIRSHTRSSSYEWGKNNDSARLLYFLTH